jgi:hypothetical protein
MNIIEEIKNQMHDCFGFDLTNKQIMEYLEEYPEAKYFDTQERDQFADNIAKKITGMHYPLYKDSEEYVTKFYKLLKKKACEHGFKLIK